MRGGVRGLVKGGGIARELGQIELQGPVPLALIWLLNVFLQGIISRAQFLIEDC